MFFLNEQLRTRQPTNKPIQLLLGDVGPREVEGDWLSLYNPSEGLRGHGAFDAQVNSRPKSLVQAPMNKQMNMLLHLIPFIQRHFNFYTNYF